MRFTAIIAFLIAAPMPGLAAVEAVNIREPRPFGYFIGDVVERQVEVVTSGDTELVSASLPRPGPLTYWLDLVSVSDDVSARQGRKVHTISLKYQLFYSPLEPKKVEIPAFPLKFRNTSAQPVASGSNADDGGHPTEVPSASIPALRLLMSPLREIAINGFMPDKKKEISDVLRPDAEARQLSTRRIAAALIASVVALAAVAALLLRHYAKWPFTKRPNRPFTIADRRIRELETGQSEGVYRESLIILHRAFDESFGRRLFATDIDAFLNDKQGFAALAHKLRRFFESSRLYFFSEDRTTAETMFPIQDVRQLATDLAREERTAA